MSYETILYSEENNVATITINRPESMNAFNNQMLEDFVKVWAHVNETDSVHAVVLKAAEGRAFCTGVDVRQGISPTQSENLWTRTDPGECLGPKQQKVWKPVIAAVHGMCAGGAMYWINECDIVICSEDATFFDPHVTYGMTSALEPIGMRYTVPLRETLRWALMGNEERMSAETAFRIGLVSEVHRLDNLYDRANEIAAEIASKPTAATQGTVRAIWESLDMPRNIALAHGMSYTIIGNPIGTAQVNRDTMMANKNKKYVIR